MDRSKLRLGQLIRGHWNSRWPAGQTEELSGKDIVTDQDSYQPPGEIFSADPSVSKLMMPAVEIDPWSVFWLVLVATTGGIGLLSYFVLTAVPPSPNCNQVVLLSTDSERLFCTKLAVETNDKKDVIAAINLVQGWSERNPLYNEGKKLLDKWSQQLIVITKQELVGNGNLPQALANLKAIPAHSAVYPDAQKYIAQWQKQWQEGQKINDKFQQAVQVGDWDTVHDSLNQVRAIQHNYWSTTRYNQMVNQAAQEEEGWEHYRAAESMAQSENFRADKILPGYDGKAILPLLASDDRAVFYVLDPNTLAKAIALTNKVTTGSYFKEKARASRERWSQTMVAIASEKLRVHKYAAAIAVAQQVPRGVNAYAAAQNTAVLAARAATLNNTASTQTELVDRHIMLDTAQQSALVGSIASLSNAIAIASQISPNEPLWTEAQSFIKFWNRQIQLLEDRPTLDQAYAYAKRGWLAQAIKSAAQLQGRIAHPLVQKEAEQWQETLTMLTIRRDRPVLDRALALASAGQLKSAIALASRVPNDSPLYNEAQTLLNRWRLAKSKAQ